MPNPKNDKSQRKGNVIVVAQDRILSLFAPLIIMVADPWHRQTVNFSPQVLPEEETAHVDGVLEIILSSRHIQPSALVFFSLQSSTTASC